MAKETEKHIIERCKQWLTRMVVGLNLCPFANHVIDNNSLRYRVFTGKSDQLADVFISELQLLDKDENIETTLFVMPEGLEDFDDFLDVLDGANQVIEALGYEGTYQIASFHPDYQFDGVEPDDLSNYTNRAPYPIFHLLREASLAEAVKHYGEDAAAEIPERNIALLHSMGIEQIKRLLG